ncbi:MAG: group 1 truncated hemoglobin [Pseudohongiellaceae bacterium]|nr:group 1 truncated hemoglobin [Pseudohongiellaceae bacterium]
MSSVFEKIGGAAAVDAAVDIFYRRVLGDPLISHFFDSVDMDRQIGKQKAFLTMAFGGPNEYTGADMRTAHKHMNLTEEHFGAVAGHLQGTLEELSVPEDLIGEVMAIAASTHDDVLNL